MSLIHDEYQNLEEYISFSLIYPKIIFSTSCFAFSYMFFASFWSSFALIMRDSISLAILSCTSVEGRGTLMFSSALVGNLLLQVLHVVIHANCEYIISLNSI